MKFEDVVETRRSFHKFSDREVEMKTIEKALDTARNAPSAWNLQPWHIKVIKDEKDIKEAYAASFDQDFLLEANKILLLLADKKIDRYADEAFDDAVEKGYYTQEHADESKSRVKGYVDRDETWINQWLNRNCMFFASTLINALWNEGVGSCPVRGFDQEYLNENFELDEDIIPLLMIPIGYPDEDKEKKWRRDTDDIIEEI